MSKRYDWPNLDCSATGHPLPFAEPHVKNIVSEYATPPLFTPICRSPTHSRTTRMQRLLDRWCARAERSDAGRDQGGGGALVVTYG